MGVILLKLAGPLQSWGEDSRYNERKTRHEPTKSGIVGLLASSLGRRREDSIEDLASLRVGVRVDQHGTLVRDFHMAHKRVYDDALSRWKMSDKDRDTYLTTRYYLSDAIFLAGIEVSDDKLPSFADALVHPAFPLFLGRRSCPPACKVLFGVRPGEGLEQALQEVPWQATSRALTLRHQGERLVSLDAGLDVAPGELADVPFYENVHDAPISFSQLYRQYEWRRVVRTKLRVANPRFLEATEEHDPFAALQEEAE